MSRNGAGFYSVGDGVPGRVPHGGGIGRDVRFSF